MQLFHTAGVPPRSGRIILPINGCTRNRSVALRKSVTANNNDTASLHQASARIAQIPTRKVTSRIAGRHCPRSLPLEEDEPHLLAERRTAFEGIVEIVVFQTVDDDVLVRSRRRVARFAGQKGGFTKELACGERRQQTVFLIKAANFHDSIS